LPNEQAGSREMAKFQRRERNLSAQYRKTPHHRTSRKKQNQILTGGKRRTWSGAEQKHEPGLKIASGGVSCHQETKTNRASLRSPHSRQTKTGSDGARAGTDWLALLQNNGKLAGAEENRGPKSTRETQLRRQVRVEKIRRADERTGRRTCSLDEDKRQRKKERASVPGAATKIRRGTGRALNR
jgi:hypothetical protein